MNRIPTRLLVIVLAALFAVGVISPASAAAKPYCGITWGSLPKSVETPSRNMILDVRAGQHACFDRLVVDLGGRDLTFRSYDVRYVPVVIQDGSGDPVPVRGAADLQILVRAPVQDEDGRVTYQPDDRRELVNVSGFRTFRQVAWAGSFEGQSTIALGVRARLPFRVFTLAALPGSEQGPRMVIDVAHRW
ncbi:AMIN-like domain-containing (lipo)protein [Blastococcus deserti]|uniref:AMIN-like domain-containing protein n=1 Tax=Blastococcus deserti TaxID=2259033 RepID=A0ABW4X908_9ACTN